MNKEVEVQGMKLQAQAEKGILINEKACVSDGTWSELALAGQDTPIAHRPASTSDLSAWWHANSKKTNLEAGIGSGSTVESDNIVSISTGVYYTNLDTTTTPDTTAAVNDTNAERTVYYTDCYGASSGSLDQGEGFYIKYTYYIKISGNEALTVTAVNLKATVKSTKNDGTGSGTTHSADALDGALRVGIQIDGDSKTTIFAPVSDADETYKVTDNASGSSATTVTPVRSSTGTETTATSINTNAVSLPAVTAPGKAVYVYVWF